MRRRVRRPPASFDGRDRTRRVRLHVETRRRLGLPVQPRRFFRLLWRHVIETGVGRLFLAEVDGRPAAGAVFLGWNRMLLYKYGASDPVLWPLRPNNLLFSEAIAWACDAGYESLDFGRTNLDSLSLRRFKLSWGAVERPLAYSFVGRRPSVARTGEPPRLLRRALRGQRLDNRQTAVADRRAVGRPKLFGVVACAGCVALQRAL